MFASKDIFLKSSAGTGPYTIPRSARFRNSASAYLNRTFSTPTSNTIWTWSAWVKRGALTGTYRLFGASTTTYLTFNSSDQLNLTLNGTSAATTTAVYRDPSSWYHIVYQQNGSTQTIYVNNVSVATGTTAASVFNTAISHQIGAANTTNYFDGYLTEINFVDGQALTPSSFGSISSTTGVWQPIAYTGTYGTNGFYLNFNSFATAAALGTDSSGNSNTWTVNNLSVTAGTTYDSMTDVPTLTSATAANYAVLNPLDNTGTSLSNGNLNVSGASNSFVGTFVSTSQKWYFEFTKTASGDNQLGILNGGVFQSSSNFGVTGFRRAWRDNAGSPSWLTDNGIAGSGTAVALANGDILGIALDLDNNAIYFAKNNTWMNSGVPTSGASKTGAIWTDLSGGFWKIYAGSNANGCYASLNSGQQGFVYTPPSGFVALNTYNLSTPTIANGAAYMAATTYTGTGASRSVANTVNGVSFQPDFVWIKSRSTTVAGGLYDSVRGGTLELISSSGAVESTQVNGVTAFGSTGFTVGTLSKLNGNGTTFVGWQWYTNGGSSSSNTNGTITSTVSAGATQGFSIVTYTGTGTAGTVGHGLGVTPSIVMVKSRNGATSWFVYDNTATTPQSQYLQLNSGNAQTTSASFWNTAATSSVFGVGTSSNINASAGTFVAYCFSAVAGFSAIGRYIGNGAADGPFIYLGFRPRFILIKSTSTASENWDIVDTSRAPNNVASTMLLANSTILEYSGTYFDVLSNGIKIRNDGSFSPGGFNTSSATYLYMAFAENPFKYSLAR